MRITHLRTHPAQVADPVGQRFVSLPAPSAPAEMLTDMDGAPSPAFYRGLRWALVPALLSWMLLIAAVLRFV